MTFARAADRKTTGLLCLALVLLAFALYAKSFANAWTLDDFPVIVHNPDITGFAEFLRDSYPGRPLRELTFLLDHALFGLEPAGWHVQNILWHGLCGALVFLLALQAGIARVPALCGALLFLCHPLQVEVVANISHRKDSLALFFCLLSAIAYLKALSAEQLRAGWLATAVLAAGVALLAKQNAVVMLPVLALLEWTLRPPQSLFRRAPQLIPVMLAAGGAAGAAYLLRGGLAGFRQEMVPQLVKFNVLPPWSEAQYFQTVAKSWAFLAGKLFWPVDLAVEYTYAVPSSWADPWVVAGLAFAVVALLVTLLTLRACPAVGAGLGWCLLFWLPTAGFWPLAYFAADRYWYAPLAGAALAVAGGLHRLGPPRRASLAAAAVVLLLLSGLTWRQNAVWRDDHALWTQAVKVSPTAPFALNNLGDVYYKRGDMPTALRYFEQANALNGNLINNQLNLALTYEQLGNRRGAVMHFLRFLEMHRMSGQHPVEAAKVKKRLRETYGVNVP